MSGVLNDYPPNYNENMEMAEIEKPIEESDGQVLMTYNPMLNVFSLKTTIYILIYVRLFILRTFCSVLDKSHLGADHHF